MAGALQGLRVLDLSRILAGPLCCMMLGDHGADVVKVEPPTGDDTRTFGPPFAGGESAYYMGLNRNKRCMVLDLSTPQGREVVWRLAMSADVLVENFKSGTMERWGMDYAALSAQNPRLVYCSVSGFGRTGPYANLPGYDAIAQAMGGMMSVNGEEGGGPLKVGIPVADLSTGLFALIGVLLALQRRSVTGRGQLVEASLLDSVVAFMHPANTNYLHSGKVPVPMGSAHPSIVPYDLYPTADKPMYLAIGNLRQFSRFAELIGHPALGTDARYGTNADRVANRSELTSVVVEALRSRTAAEWCRVFWDNGIPAGPVNTMDQVFQDPQVLSREMLQAIAHPTAGTYHAVGIPVKLHESPGGISQAPPLFGEHTVELLGELAYSEGEIDDMLRSKVAMQYERGRV